VPPKLCKPAAAVSCRRKPAGADEGRARAARHVATVRPKKRVAKDLQQYRLTPELSRPTTREPGVEPKPQQRTCLQMGRSGVGLNDLLGGAAPTASRTPQRQLGQPATSRNSTSPGRPALYPGPARRHAAEDGPAMIEPGRRSHPSRPPGQVAEGDRPEPMKAEPAPHDTCRRTGRRSECRKTFSSTA